MSNKYSYENTLEVWESPCGNFMNFFIKDYCKSLGVGSESSCKEILSKLENNKALINLNKLEPSLQNIILRISKDGPNFTPGFLVTNGIRTLQMLEFLDSRNFFEQISRLYNDVKDKNSCNTLINVKDIDFNSMVLRYKIVDGAADYACMVDINMKFKNSNMSINFSYHSNA